MQREGVANRMMQKARKSLRILAGTHQLCPLLASVCATVLIQRNAREPFLLLLAPGKQPFLGREGKSGAALERVPEHRPASRSESVQQETNDVNQDERRSRPMLVEATHQACFADATCCRWTLSYQ